MSETSSEQLLKALVNFDFSHYPKLWLGYSGGMDSSVLLHALCKLPSLKEKLNIIHINHGLNNQSDSWQEHCEQTCHSMQLPMIAENISNEIFQDQNNIEELARNARYDIFEKKIQTNEALLLAHHQQDQAETVLLRLFRGAGIDGLSAMKHFTQRNKLTLLRPFLDISKEDIINYALQNKLEWIEDPSNSESQFNRNFLRNELFPIIKSRYPGAEKNLARTAKLCNETQSYLNKSIEASYQNCIQKDLSLYLEALQKHSLPEQMLLIRKWLTNFNLKMPNYNQLLAFLKNISEAKKDKHPLLVIDGFRIQADKQHLHCYKKNIDKSHAAMTLWPVPYKPISVDILGGYLTLKKTSIQRNFYLPDNANIEIRYRQGGEKIKINGMTQKVKKLLQNKKIPLWQRDQLPFLYIDNELAAVCDVIIADPFNQKEKNNYYLSMQAKSSSKEKTNHNALS